MKFYLAAVGDFPEEPKTRAIGIAGQFAHHSVALFLRLNLFARIWCGLNAAVYRDIRKQVKVPIAVDEHYGARRDTNALIENR